MIAVIDYKKGNLQSVARGIEAAGGSVLISSSPADIAHASAVVLPGVGAFTDAMATMEELGLADAVKAAVSRDVPFLGICLGLHLMFESGEEHAEGDAPTPGLGLIPGTVVQIPRTDSKGNAYKVPHVGWNSVDLASDSCPLFEGIPSGEYFYFTHSYMAPSGCGAEVGLTTHSVTFPSAIWKDNMYGVQFHPEKSSDAGARLLANFVHIANG